jgi:predicted ATPase
MLRDPLSPPDLQSNNLPPQATPLIGRGTDIDDVRRRLLLTEVRLLTLLGPAGVGKTRLAMEAARQSLGDFADGVYFVELAPIANPALVLSTVAKVLGVQEGVAQSLPRQVQQNIGGKSVLLVLDNFEQILGAAGGVAELLIACPYVKVLGRKDTYPL